MPQNNSSLIVIINNILQAYVKRLNDLTHLAKLEAKLAAKTLVTIFILVLFLAILLITSWMSVIALFVTYLLSLHCTLLFSTAMAVLLNLLVTFCITGIIFMIKKNLFFPATRRQFTKHTITNEEGTNEQPT